MDSIIIKNTENKGMGIFANKKFSKDEFILYVDGEVVEMDDSSKLSQFDQDHCFPFDDHRYVMPKEPWMYLNHSCSPNAGIKENRTIVAMMEINIGEEITIDYSMNNNEDWTMECKCGARNCRKIIGNFGTLDKEIQRRYYHYIPDFIRRQYFK